MSTASNVHRGLKFNGHHTSEFGLVETTDDIIGMPTKNKVNLTPIGSNAVIDLSNLYGPTFSERTLTKTFLADREMWAPERQYLMWTTVINWLMQTNGKVPLWDDIMDDWHYLAEVQAAPIFKEDYHQATVQVTWQCYPFRIKDSPEFDDVWDTFNFETDVAQETHLDVDYPSTTLINTGVADVELCITSNSAGVIHINESGYQLVSGDNMGTELVLIPGENTVSIDAGMSVDISWYQEMI